MTHYEKQSERECRRAERRRERQRQDGIIHTDYDWKQ